VREVEAVVVGAGPAGSAAAYRLARAGVRVLLVERDRFPREKVCGDGLTPRSVGALHSMDVDPEALGFQRNVGLRVIGGDIKLELPWPRVEGWPAYGYACPRNVLDEILARHAEKAGAELLEGTEVAGPLEEAGRVKGVRLRTPEGETKVRARLVIAADGASSRFATALGLHRDPRRPLGVAARRYYPSVNDKDPFIESYLELWAGTRLMPGYGWIFPMGDGTVNVGVGQLDTSQAFRRTDYRRLLADWLPSVRPEWGIEAAEGLGEIRTGPLPMGHNRWPALHREVMLVGDAAGMVNPFNGEGIAYALETGLLAGEVAAEALRRGDLLLLHRYPEEIRGRYGAYYSIARMFVKVIGARGVMKATTRYLLPHRGLMGAALKLMSNLYAPSGGHASDRVIRSLVRAWPSGG